MSTAKARNLTAVDHEVKSPATMRMYHRGSLIGITWLQQVLCNFAWVPLTAYAISLELDAAIIGSLFAVHVGIRVVPNMAVARWGRKSEFPMMLAASAGYLAAFFYPTSLWALYALAAGGGLAFTRGCVTLHMQALCDGDVDLLGRVSRQCGMARTCSDIFGFVVPPVIYESVGWGGFAMFGASQPLLYCILAIPLHCRARAKEAAPDAMDKPEVASRWIDWALAGAFVSTELQWYLLNAAVPAALAHGYSFPASHIGVVFALGCLVSFAYLFALPYFPRVLKKHRPLNLLITYFGMTASWLLMAFCLAVPLPAPAFTIFVFLFLAMATASQIVLLECIMGVGDAKATAKVLGISEVLGCLFGMCGSYTGGALVDLGIPAPFLAAAFFSLLSSCGLALALGRRRVEVELDPTNRARGAKVDRGSCALALVGLHLIAARAEDFIRQELAYRGKCPSIGACNIEDVEAAIEKAKVGEKSGETMNEEGLGARDIAVKLRDFEEDAVRDDISSDQAIAVKTAEEVVCEHGFDAVTSGRSRGDPSLVSTTDGAEGVLSPRCEPERSDDSPSSEEGGSLAA